MNGASETEASPSATIDRATLNPIVRSALKSSSAQIIHWKSEQVHGGAGIGNSIHRFKGQAHDQGQQMPWSVILKSLDASVGSAEISAWDYYKREADAYRSGWLDDLPGGLTAPRSYGIVEYADGTCWIWLEDIADAIGAHWPLDHYGIVARHLGQFNGAYMVESRRPAWPWLSTRWLQGFVNQSGPALPIIRDSPDHPLLRLSWPGGADNRLFFLWEHRDRYFGALERLPQTLCHMDIFRRNLFTQRSAGGKYETTAVDWAFAGWGAIGEELVPLIIASVAFTEVDLDQVQELEEIVFEGYLAGLHQAGWRGDRRHVRLGYTAASLRYRFAELPRAVRSMMDEKQTEQMSQIFGLPPEEICKRWAQIGEYCDDLNREAWKLMDDFGW